jgi:hypothetical protein
MKFKFLKKKQLYFKETTKMQLNLTNKHLHLTLTDANLVITWSRKPHAMTPIPWKPTKSGLIGVWHKDNMYLSTSTIGNRNPHPTNIDSRTRSIRMTPRRQLFFDKSFFSSLENRGREIIYPTHTQKVRQTRSFINMNCLTLHVWLCPYL